jgi:hypothetical protein
MGIIGKANGVLGFRYDREGQASLDVDGSLTSAPVVTDIIDDNGDIAMVCGK